MSVRPADTPCFIDTQVFVSASFDPNSKPLGILKHLTAHRHIHILLPSVTERELQKHLAIEVCNECDKLLAADSSAKALRLIRPASSRDIYFKINIKDHVENLERRVLSAFHTLLNEFRVVRLDCNSVSLSDILDDHFELRPPFSVKKPYEFKDAIVVRSLRSYVEEHGVDNIIVVSADKDLHNAFRGDERFDVYKNLTELATKYPSESLDSIVDVLLEGDLVEDLGIELESYVLGMGLYLENVDGEIDLLEDRFDIPKPLVLSASEDKILYEDGRESKLLSLDLWWDISVTVFVRMSYEVPGTGTYDKESGKVYFPETDSEDSARTINLPVHAEIEVEISDDDIKLTQAFFSDLGRPPDLYFEPRNIDYL